MLIRSLINPITRNADGEGSGGAPDIAALVAAEVQKVTAGLKSKNEELLNEVKSERQRRVEYENQIRSMGSQDDINKARELMERMQADADLRMIVEGGKAAFEDVLTRRTKTVVSQERAAKEAAERAAAEAAARAEAAQNRWRAERLNYEVTSAVSKAKALPEAAEYIRIKAEQMFALDDETGKPRLRDGIDAIDRSGNPHTLETWVDSLRDSNPFFFGMPSGGGAGGGNNANGRAPIKINSSDSKAISGNLEAIAAGKAVLA
jgi:hypothetical protein